MTYMSDSARSCIEQLSIRRISIVGETYKGHFFDCRVCIEKRLNLTNGYTYSLRYRIPIDTATDSGECYCFDIVFKSNLEASSVAGCKQLRLALFATMPDRSHGVDDMFCRKITAGGDFRIAGFAAVEFAAFFEDRGPACAVDGPVDAPAAEEALVGGVDDGVDALPGDIALHGFDNG